MVWPSCGTGARGGGVGDDHVLLDGVADALAGEDGGAFGRGQRVPLRVPGADGDGAVDFGEAVDVGDVEAEAAHAFEHGGGRGGAGGHDADGLGEGLDAGVVEDHAEDDGGAAHVGDAVIGDGGQDVGGVDPAEADVGAGHGGDGPGEAPAVAVKHRQGPEIDGVLGHAPGHGVAAGVQVGAAVVVDDALGVAGGAGGVVEGDGVPLVGREGGGEGRVAGGEEGFVGDGADGRVGGGERVVDVDDEGGGVLELGEGFAHHGGVFGVDEDGAGFGVAEDVGDRGGVEPCVEGVEDGAEHGDGEVGFDHGGGVGSHDGHGVAAGDAGGGEGGGEAAAAVVGLAPALAVGAVDCGDAVGEGFGGAAEEADWGERGVVGPGLWQVEHGVSPDLRF